MTDAERLAQLATSSSYLIPDTRHAIAAELRRLSAEVEALRKENAELKLLFPQTSPHGAEALGIVHRSPLMEFGMRNRQMGIEEGRRQHDAEVEALRKDAERYRWLRDCSLAHRIIAPQATLMDGDGIKISMTFPGVEPRTQPVARLFGEHLDKAIDAVLAARPGECHHKWVDADNAHVKGADLCLNCGAIRGRPGGAS